MKTVDLRQKDRSCVDNPVVKIVNLLTNTIEPIEVIVYKDDVPENVLRYIAKMAGFEVENIVDEGESYRAILKKHRDRSNSN